MSGDYQLRCDIDRFNTLFSNFENTVKDKLGLDDIVTLADVLDNYQTKYDADRERSELIDLIYPVGAIFVSTNNVNPSTLFGGTWEQIEGKFLLASSEDYELGGTGGEAEHTLTVDEMPSHKHDLSYRTGVITSGSAGTYYFDVGTADNWRTNSPSIRASGGDEAHNNMPPYLTVNVWERTE